jgi:hypothetical protein
VSGWVLDPNTLTSIKAHIYVDGQFNSVVTASGPGPDVLGVYQKGANHGFNTILSLAVGTHAVCVYGINVAAGNANSQIGCKSVTIGNLPFGGANSFTAAGPNVVHTTGWTIDPEITTPIRTDFWADGRTYVGSATANTYRSDVVAVFPGWGANHGWDANLTVANGVHTICAYAVNERSGNGNPGDGLRHRHRRRFPVRLRRRLHRQRPRRGRQGRRMVHRP